MTIEIDLTDRLDNMIFPLGKATYDDELNCVGFDQFGTAFLIGHEGFALTAGHVVNNIKSDITDPKHQAIAGIFKDTNNQKYACSIQFQENTPLEEEHPNHDVSIFKLDFDKDTVPRPPFIIEKGFRLPAADYYSVGYPTYLALDNHLNARLPDGTIVKDEINILNKGYIKRLVNYNVGRFKGNKLLELSEVGTAGFSGAPIVSIYATKFSLLKDNKTTNEVVAHRLLGIYIGENQMELGDGHISYGYAASVEAFADWKPKIGMGKNLQQIMMILMMT